MKRIALVLVSIIIMLSFIGCSSKSQTAAPNISKAGGAAAQEQAKAPADNAQDQSKSTTQTTTLPAEYDSIRKIIYNASVAVDVKDLKSTSDSITSKAKEMGGYVANSSIDGNYCQITVKVPAGKLDEFLKYIDTLGGENKQASVSTDDITDQYTDTTSRIKNLQAEEAQLLEIMKKATTVDETLKVQSELYRVRGEIETLQGRVNMWDKLVELSTIDIKLRKIPEIGGKEVSVTFISWKEIADGINNGFNATLNFLIRFFSWLFVLLISSLPVLPFIGIAIWLTIRYIKKRKKINK